MDESYIPTDGWEPIAVPTYGVEYYFRNYYGWPLKGGRYEPSKTAINTEWACGFMPNEGRENNAMYLRTTLTLPADWERRRLLLTADMIQYKVKIWVNDQLAYEGFHGWVVPLEADLSKFVKPGENTIMIYCGRAWLYQFGESRETWGPYGGITLKSVPDVYVSDVWVIPHWRQATIETRTQITNTADTPCKLVLNQKAVLHNRTKRDLGDQEIEVPAGATIELRRDVPWSDPVLWGIGGDYGQPVLHQLVSTLSTNGQPTDQHFQSFGYREFWKSTYDYWLNGKRLFIQGNVPDGPAGGAPRQYFRSFFALLRDTCNTNTLRGHDNVHQGRIPAEVCDELGMLYVPNMYPLLRLPDPNEQIADDIEWFKQTPEHQENVRRYTAWVKWLRNHPSVVIYSTDNEVFTQASGKPWDDAIRADRLAALYEQLVNELDPTRLVTRDGDQGTWGAKTGAWEQPDADIANYHYPEHHPKTQILNWQSTYGKPVLFGETIYSAYGAWDQWIGAKPSQVAARAQAVRTFIGMYRDLEISGWIGMGPGSDGFLVWENGSKGTWVDGRTPFQLMPQPETGEQAAQWYREGKAWPGCRLRWPAQSGPGLKYEFGAMPNAFEGHKAINWYVPTITTTDHIPPHRRSDRHKLHNNKNLHQQLSGRI